MTSTKLFKRTKQRIT